MSQLTSDSAYRALNALVDHVTAVFGWREVARDDEGTYVTLYNGQVMLDISITPDEEVDNISEYSAGAFTPREFNDND